MWVAAATHPSAPETVWCLPPGSLGSSIAFGGIGRLWTKQHRPGYSTQSHDAQMPSAMSSISRLAAELFYASRRNGLNDLRSACEQISARSKTQISVRG